MSRMTPEEKKELYSGNIEVHIPFMVDMYRSGQPSLKLSTGMKVRVIEKKPIGHTGGGASEGWTLQAKLLMVKVVGGLLDGEIGFLPKAAIHDYALASLGRDAIGISYGGSKWYTKTPTDDRGTSQVSVFMQESGPDAEKYRCILCGNKANAHKLYANNLAVWACQVLHYALVAQGVRNLLTSNGTMIGVAIEADGRIWYAHSGKTDLVTDEGAFNAALKASSVPVNNCVWAYARTLKNTDAWHFPSGHSHPEMQLTMHRLLTTIHKDGYGNMSDLYCAAPKLIQACFRNTGKIASMAEMWLSKAEGGPLDKQFFESCNYCRLTIPLMLCPDF